MKIIKKILLVLVTVIIVLLIVALFVKKDYSIEKEVTINKSKTEVYNYIQYLKNQDEFSKWAKMDPNMRKDFKGTDATVGFTSYWDGNSEAGKGEQEIKKITPGERIDYEIRFIKPMKSTAQAYMITEALGENQSKVKWGFTGHMPYPFNLMRLFGMEKMIGEDLQIGLNNLKVIQEK